MIQLNRDLLVKFIVLNTMVKQKETPSPLTVWIKLPDCESRQSYNCNDDAQN